jgi:hypothetical protein
MATVNVFAEAPIAPAKPKKQSKAKAERETIEFADLDLLASCAILTKALDGVQKQLSKEVKGKGLNYLAGVMVQTKKAPASLTAMGEMATGLLTLKRRGSNLTTDAKTVERLAEVGIALDEVEEIPERFVINPEVLEDQELMMAISEAVSNHPKLKGVAVVQKQERQVRHVVAETTLGEIAKNVEDKEQIKLLLSGVASVQLGRYQFEGLTGSDEQVARALLFVSERGLL